MLTFLTILDQIKVYHWQTTNYARHKATDELHGELSSLVDKFIECLNGRLGFESPGYRIMLNENRKIKLTDMNDSNGITFLLNIKNYLESNELIDVMSNSSELINIRDEMLSAVGKTNYLFSLG